MSALKLTDAVLFDRWLPFDARAVLAVTLGHRGRNPSVDYIAAAIGLKPKTVLTAQRVLEYGTCVWTMDDAGAISLVADCPATATFDRPSEWYERHPNSPQFHRSTRLDVLAPWAKLPDNVHTELPAEIAAQLPKREHHNSILRLVALAYAREQLIRGAIQIEDDALGFLLGASARQVRRARELLLKHSILRFERREQPSNIYTMPGGTPGRPLDADGLNPRRTRRLAPLALGPLVLHAYASENELDHAARLIDKLGVPFAALALVLAFPTVEDRLHGRDVLAALDRVDRDGQLSVPRRVTECLPDTYQRKTSMHGATVTSPPEAIADPTQATSAGEGKQSRGGLVRRQYGRDWYSCFYFADDVTHAAILAVLRTIEERHGQGEAAFELRKACLVRGTKANGRRVLELLRQTWGSPAPVEKPSATAAALLEGIYEG